MEFLTKIVNTCYKPLQDFQKLFLNFLFLYFTKEKKYKKYNNNKTSLLFFISIFPKFVNVMECCRLFFLVCAVFFSLLFLF